MRIEQVVLAAMLAGTALLGGMQAAAAHDAHHHAAPADATLKAAHVTLHDNFKRSGVSVAGSTVSVMSFTSRPNCSPSFSIRCS
jgi:hypothetical protein